MKNTKKTRRVAAFAAAVMMAACVAVSMSSFSASAASVPEGEVGNTITITNTDGATHTYAAYQIFAGDIDDGVLTNIEWGDGVNSAQLLSALQTASRDADSPLYGLFPSTVTDAEGVAKVLGSTTGDPATAVFADDEEKAQAFAKIVGANLISDAISGTYADNAISGLPDGYYLVQDSVAPTNSADDRLNSGAKTRYIVKVTSGESVSVTAKHSAPSVMKKVLEEGYNATDAIAGDTVKFGNDTDADTAGVQNDYTLEKDYNDVADYSIGDMVPFTLYGSLPDTFGDYDHYYYEFTDTLAKGFVAPAKTDIHVYVDNEEVTTQVASGITVADNGDDGIAIKVVIMDVKGLTDVTVSKNSIITVKYSAKLDVDAEIGLNGNENKVKLTYSNNPNNTGTGSAKPGDTGETPEDKVIVFTYEQDFTKKDADTGDNLTDAEFVLQRSSDGKYLVVDSTASTTGNYVVGSWTATKGEATTLKTTDGTYKIKGLEDGVYIVEETQKPAGYNDPTDTTTELTIAATTVNGQKWKTTAADALKDLTLTAANDGLNAVVVTLGDADHPASLDNGIVDANIYNTKGSSLPSTGGIGTTLFYVGGGVLVAGAGVLLITKKRAKKDAE